MNSCIVLLTLLATLATQTPALKVRIDKIEQTPPAPEIPANAHPFATVLSCDEAGECTEVWTWDQWVGEEWTAAVVMGQISEADALKLWAARVLREYQEHLDGQAKAKTGDAGREPVEVSAADALAAAEAYEASQVPQ